MKDVIPKKYIITERILDECIEALELDTTLNSVTIKILKNIKSGERTYRLEGVTNLLGFTPIKEDI
tara:strand:- start:714 stop:911 length:198 start_codon:yes stop_codon:yes gene_type:complete